MTLTDIPRGEHLHGGSTGWMINATYRVPLDGTTHAGNVPKASLVVRQSYAFTTAFNDFEPTHALTSVNCYPQVTFSVSDPNTTGPLADSIRVTQRLALTPQAGQFLPDVPDEYSWGLFRDNDYPTYWMYSNVPFASVDCQPLPIWFNLFKYGRDTTSSVTKEMIFDTDDGPTWPTPDNVHVNHRHLKDIGSWSEFHAEAPGAFESIHLHWRWAASFGPEFGSGEVLLPPNQKWVMGIVGTDFPEEFNDFTSLMLAVDPLTGLGNAITTAEKVLLIRCEQSSASTNRQYYTLTPGFSYAVGGDTTAALNRCILENVGGYDILRVGFGSTEQDTIQRRNAEDLIEMAVFLGIRDADSGWLDYFWGMAGYNKVGRVFRGQQPCIEAHGSAAMTAFLFGNRTADSPALTVGNVAVPGGLAGQGLPFTVNVGGTFMGTNVTFSELGGTSGFRVAENLLLDASGYCVRQRVGAAGSALQVSFSDPVRQVRNLALAVNQTSGAADVTVNMFLGGGFVGAQTLTLAGSPGGRFVEAIVKLDPGQSFDRFTVVSNNSSKELAVGGFQFATTVIESGDINCDGAVDANDLQLFEETYTGPTRARPPWAADADLNNDGHVDAADYQLLLTVLETPPPTSTIVIESASPLSLEPITLLQEAQYEVSAVDLAGGTVSYSWTSDAGTFDDAASASPVWTPPALLIGPFQELAITLTIESSGGGSKTITYSQTVTDPFGYSPWATSFGLSEENGMVEWDADGDTWNNFKEFAFGTNPGINDAGAMILSGSVLVKPGEPITSVVSVPNGVDFGLVFCRRKGLAGGHLSYSVQFSADLFTWENSTEIPIALADDGVIEAVKVPHPFFLSDGRKAQFSRVTAVGR